MKQKPNMWSSFLVGPPGPSHLLAVSATAQPNRRRSHTFQNDGISTGQVGESGHTLLTALQSNARQREQEGEGSQIRGSDVLWALQRASARKKNKQKKQRREEESSSVSSRREHSDVDYANVRPLRVKSEWGDKLDELEKRLRELSEII